MNQAVLIVRYSEIGLKGDNRKHFENRLADHIRSALKGMGKVRKIRGRILIDGEENALSQSHTRLSKIPGIQNYSVGRSCEPIYDEIQKEVLSLYRTRRPEGPFKFKISTQRSDKSFHLQSVEVNQKLGAKILEEEQHHEDVKVDLKKPDLELQVEIHRDRAMVFCDKIPGPGGLPVGSAGEVLCLLSGGIDSPVAAYQMIRRGCKVHFIFFENKVFLGRAAYHKVLRLAEALSQYQPSTYLHIVPFSNIQVAIRDHCSEKNRVILYRRFMVKIAERLARKKKQLALVTGENLGQVASQTLENMHVVNEVSDLCIYRPLLCYDKVDIMRKAQDIETYDISIEEAPDCCTVFMPQKPVIKAKSSDLEADESKLDVEALISEALEEIESLKVGGEPPQ